MSDEARAAVTARFNAARSRLAQLTAESDPPKELVERTISELKAAKEEYSMLSKRARGEPRGGKRLRPNGPRPDVDFYPESVCWSELADPADSRYTRSFRPDPEDACAARDFFENHGFVVFRDVLSVAEITTTVDEIWRYLEAEVSGFDHSDPGTWSRLSSATYGLPTLQSIYCRALLSNRQNPLLCAAIATLLGTEDFLVSQDRFCTYRPTQAGPGFPAHPEWKTRGNLHLDVHPWNYLSGATALEELDYQHPVDFITETNSVVCVGGPHIQVPRPVLVALRMLRLGDGLGIWFHVLRRAPARCTRRLTLQHCRLHRSPHQGVLNLIDNLAVDGGTLLIPRFHRAFRGWVAALGSESENLRAGANRGWVVPRTQGGGSFKFPADDPIHAKAHRIPLRAGSYLCWNQELVHGSQPNDSGSWRMAQFIKAYRRDGATPERAVRRAKAVAARIAEAGLTEHVTDLGARVFGLEN